MNGLMLRRQAMMAAKAEQAPMYLRGLGDTTNSEVVLPFKVNKNNLYYIEVDFYFARNEESGSYHHFMHNNQIWSPGGLITCKGWSQFFSGNGSVYGPTLPYNRVTIDMTDGTRTCYGANNTSSSITISFSSYGGPGSVLILLCKTRAIKEIKVWNSTQTMLIYDFVPAYDSNNVACLHDTVNDQYYYSTDTLEIVSDPTIA